MRPGRSLVLTAIDLETSAPMADRGEQGNGRFPAEGGDAAAPKMRYFGKIPLS